MHIGIVYFLLFIFLLAGRHASIGCVVVLGVHDFSGCSPVVSNDGWL